jgi:hypothetical protein
MQRLMWRSGALLAAVVLLAFTLVLSLGVPTPTPAYAQFEEPTSTPTAAYWLAYAEARSAIEEAENVDLTIVRKWDWWQDDWSRPNPNHFQDAAGIDSCDLDVPIVLARPIFYGFAVQITSLNNNTYEARVSFDLQEVVVCDELSSEVAAPAPAPDNPDLPGAIVGAGAAGDFELGGHVVGLDAGSVQAMRTAGMTWVKKQVRHGSTPLQGGIDIINDAKNNGFRVVLGVVGDRNAVGADFDNYVSGYSTYVRALAEAGADAIEVWNEPNIDREWPTGQVNGANYTRLLAEAFNAIKSGNPNTIVISGAPAPTGFFGAAGCADGGCNDDVFMQQMRDAGAANYFDCLGLHYNEGIVSPTVQSGDPRGEFPTYYFQSMTSRGSAIFPGKPVCYTELGYVTPDTLAGNALPANFGWAANTSRAEQTQWLAEAAAAAAQRGDVRMMIIWNINFTNADPNDPMRGYAINVDGSCPACTALGQVMGG